MIHPFSAASVEKSVSAIVCAAVSSAPWKTSTSGCGPAPDGASSRNVRERPWEVIVTVLVPLGPEEVVPRGIATRETGEEEDAGVVAEVAAADEDEVALVEEFAPTSPVVVVLAVFAPALPHATSISAPIRPARNAATS